MGKRIISQARGKGGPRYKAPSFKYAGAATHRSWANATLRGLVRKFVHCPGHSSPLAVVEYEDGEVSLQIAPEGIRVGDELQTGLEAPIEVGNTTALKNIPEGAFIYNIEGKPGDGGKYARSSGICARVASKAEDKIIVRMPSKKNRIFNPACRASIGVTAGGGRTEKPILKAGKKYFKMKAKNKLWPKVSGGSMNAVDHPFGNKRSSRKSKSKPVPRHAPPGRKVGMLRPRTTGRKTGSKGRR